MDLCVLPLKTVILGNACLETEAVTVDHRCDCPGLESTGGMASGYKLVL